MPSVPPLRLTPADASRDKLNGSPPLAVEARDIHKAFAGRAVLTGASLAVPRGSVTVIQGANGIGKTTLLRILATVVVPDAGSARVEGFDVVRQARRVRERIGVAFVNERSMYWRLNGRENLRLFASTRGIRSQDRDAEIARVAEDLALEPLLDHRVADLSTGQRQRLILARALLNRPALLLLDEPLRGLDDEAADRFLELILRRARAGDSSVIFTPTVREYTERRFSLLRLRDGLITTDTGHQ